MSKYDYKSLEEKLRTVVSYFADKLNGEAVEQIKEFIEHGEYGEAYELLCHVVASAKQQIPADVYEIIMELGRQMELPNEIWEKIKPLRQHP